MEAQDEKTSSKETINDTFKEWLTTSEGDHVFKKGYLNAMDEWAVSLIVSSNEDSVYNSLLQEAASDIIEHFVETSSDFAALTTEQTAALYSLFDDVNELPSDLQDYVYHANDILSDLKRSYEAIEKGADLMETEPRATLPDVRGNAQDLIRKVVKKHVKCMLFELKQ